MLNLEHRKLNFIESFLHINDVEIIDKLEKVIQLDFKKDKQEDLKPMSLESFYEMIDISHQQHLNGDVYTEEEVDNLIDSWK
jgi:hypothetical protein